MREREQRVDEVLKLVLAACIDKVQLKSDRKLYLQGNEELAIDTVSFLDCIHNRLGIEVNINLRNNKTDEFTPLCDEEEEERIYNQEEISNENQNDRQFFTAITLLGDNTKSGYERVRSQMLQELPQIKKGDLPSYYIITKNRPNIEVLLFAAEQCLTDNNDTISDDVNVTVEEADPKVVSLCRPVLDKDDAAIIKGIRDDNKIEGAKIEGK